MVEDTSFKKLAADEARTASQRQAAHRERMSSTLAAGVKEDIVAVTPFFRKGIVGDWQSIFSNEQVFEFERREAEVRNRMLEQATPTVVLHNC